MRTANRRNPAIILVVEDDRGDPKLIRGRLWQGARFEMSKNIMPAFTWQSSIA